MEDISIKVLLIEDNPGQAGLIRKVLAEVQYPAFHLEWVEQLSTGLDRLAAGGIDLVLLDLSLSNGQGFDTLIRVRTHIPEVPLVVIGDVDDETLVTRAVQQGAQDYLFKEQVESYLLVTTILYAITRKQTDEALKKSRQIERAKQEWEVTVDSLAQLVCLLDNQGCIVRANRTVENWHLVPVVDVKGQRLHELFHPGCTDLACYLELFWLQAWQALAQGRATEIEAYDQVLKRHLHFQVRPISTETQWRDKVATSFAVVIVNDITQRKQGEEALRKAKDELEIRVAERTAALKKMNEQLQYELTRRKEVEATLEAERASLAQRVAERTAELKAINAELVKAVHAKDEFLATMSHELRTPLTAILGMCEIMRATVYGPLTERQFDGLHSIEESGHRLLTLINGVLDFSTIEAGKLQLVIESVSVHEVCQDSLRSIQQQAQKKNIELFSAFDQTVDTLQADKRRLKQILVNLLHNAVKFTPEGGQVGLEVKGDKNRGIVHFTIWDTGIGLAKKDMDRLFKPFVQLDSGLSRKYEGAGLGLALAHRLTEMHGGHVTVQSEAGQGSRFTVSLPW